MGYYDDEDDFEDDGLPLLSFFLMLIFALGLVGAMIYGLHHIGPIINSK